MEPQSATLTTRGTLQVLQTLLFESLTPAWFGPNASVLSALQTTVPPEMQSMDPSVLCGPNKMKFMAQAGVQQFAMDAGEFHLLRLGCADGFKWFLV